MNYRLVGLIVFLSILPATAQDDVRAAAERYVYLPETQSLISDILGPAFMDPLLTAFGGNSLTAEHRQIAVKISAEEMTKFRPKMEAAMIDAAAEIFSKDELDSLISFYSSPAGASAMKKMIPFNSAYLGKVGADIRALGGVIETRISTELQAK